MKLKNIVKIAALLIFVSSLIFAQEMKPEAATLYNAGNKLLKSGQYNGAIAKYDSSLAIQEHPNTLYQKSIALKKLRKFNEAEKALTRCIELNPDFVAAYSGLGTTYYSLKKYQLAIDNFQKYIEKTDNEKSKKKVKKFIGLAYTQLGQEAKRNGKHKKAIEYLMEAVKNYKYDSAYLALAEIYIELGEFEKALQAADNAINYRKKISKGAGYYYKGLAFKGLGDKEKARENFKISVKDRTYKANSKYELKQLK
jgi:tetratricopeptide (TPR) repeat protein